MSVLLTTHFVGNHAGVGAHWKWLYTSVHTMKKRMTLALYTCLHVWYPVNAKKHAFSAFHHSKSASKW